MRNSEPYSAATIDAKLETIITSFDTVREEIRTVREEIWTVEARLDGKIVAVDARIDGLRNEMKIWFLILGILVTPVVTGISSRAFAMVWPLPPGQSQPVR